METAPKHRFQSFWAGDALTPYELFCLKSFIDHGHAVDLYTFNTNVLVPAGVRICDARELFNPDQFFVYNNGFGKGSPAALQIFSATSCLSKREAGGWTPMWCVSPQPFRSSLNSLRGRIQTLSTARFCISNLTIL